MSRSARIGTTLIGISLSAVAIGWISPAPDSVDIRAVEASTVVKASDEVLPTVFKLSEVVDEVRWGRNSQTLTILSKSASDRDQERHLLTFSPDSNTQGSLLGTREVVLGLAVSPDGKAVFVGQWRTGIEGVCQVLMFDAVTGEEIGRLDGAPLNGLGVAFSSDPLSIAVSPDGRFLAAGTKLVDTSVLHGGHIGGEVCLWSIADKTLLWSRRQTHTDIVECVTFSPDGKMLASAGDDKQIRLWDSETGELRQTLVGAAWGGVASVAWSPDGSSLATGGMGEEDGGSVRIWDIESGRMSHRFHAFRSRSHVRVAFSPDGRLFATGMKKDAEGNQFRIHSWDSSSGEHLGMLAEGEGATRAIDVSPDGRRIAVGTYEGSLMLFKLPRSSE